jgi:prepilin-type N-terminal cleavage/methylation domain-containing protein
MLKIGLKTQNGFTLVELLIGLLILSIITLGITAALDISFRSHRFASEQIDAIREARQCLPAIIDEIKYCSSVTSISADSSTLNYLDADNVSSTIFRDTNTGSIRITKNSVTKDLTAVKVDNLVFMKNDQQGLTIKVQIDINNESLTTTVRVLNFTS